VASDTTVTQGIVGVAPAYVFPVAPLSAPTSGTNSERFNWIMYLQLYQFTNSGIDPANSLADPPVYSDGNTVVTIHLKSFKWSDGTPVTARDIEFFYNLAKANKSQWSGYVEGQFPDNVTSLTAPNSTTIVAHLNKAYNPIWYTDNELSLWVALPQHAWDKTSLTGKIGNYDETTAGALSVYKFLTAQSSITSTYATSPLWKVVDGPWEIKSFQPTTGPDVFVPNPYYPNKPKIKEFIETIYATDTSEFNALLAGNEINIGTIPAEDLPQLSRLESNYTFNEAPLWHIGFDNLNYKNPTTGPIVSQLYVRQALQHLEDLTGQANTYLDNEKAGYPSWGPIPPKPTPAYVSSVQSKDPYPFSVSAARTLLTSHGWTIPSSGPATCTKPGTAANECGAGIASGAKLEFNFLYDTGQSFLTSEVANFKSDAAEAGVIFNVSSAPFQTVVGTFFGPASGWQMGTWNAEGYSGSDESPYPAANWVNESTNYTSPELTKLANATYTSSNGLAAIKAWDAYVTKNLPVLWTLTTYGLQVISKNLKGVVFAGSGFENTTAWNFS
jgi:peptide/nickel transport system substrate-binding protein